MDTATQLNMKDDVPASQVLPETLKELTTMLREAKESPSEPWDKDKELAAARRHREQLGR